MCGGPVSRILYRGLTRGDDHSSGPRIASRPRAANPDPRGEAPLPPVSGGVGSLFGIAPGGACHAGDVAAPPVGFYPTVSPVPPHAEVVCSLWRCPSALAVRALPGTVASWSPDFPRGIAPPRPSGPPHGSRGRAGARARQWLAWTEGAEPPAGIFGERGLQAGKRAARSAAMPASVGSRGPVTPGRKRRRKAASRVSASASAV